MIFIDIAFIWVKYITYLTANQPNEAAEAEAPTRETGPVGLVRRLAKSRGRQYIVSYSPFWTFLRHLNPARLAR